MSATKPKPGKNLLPIALALSLTLGLAPFFPEPHLWGKIKWLMGGAEDMQAMDYFDLVLHSAPWVFLIITLIAYLRSR